MVNSSFRESQPASQVEAALNLSYRNHQVTFSIMLRTTLARSQASNSPRALEILRADELRVQLSINIRAVQRKCQEVHF